MVVCSIIFLSVRGADCDIDRAGCDTDCSSLTLSIWLLNTGQVTAVILCPGVAWVSKRLSSAHALRLDVEDWQRLAVATRQALSTMTCLEQLEVIGRSSATGDAAVAHLMSFSHLVAGATKLTVLSACFGKLPWFPPFVHVKHLVLSLGGDIDPGIVFAAIPNANSLETLLLRTPNRLLEAPLLQLDSMRFLCAVALEGICPAGINLPEKCTMHLKGLLNFEIRGRTRGIMCSTV